MLYPSQGTNTVWLDFGDPGWIPRLANPKLDLHRFYRISQVATATLDSPAVSLAFYRDGAPIVSNTVSGFIEVRYAVDLGTSSNLLSEVLVFVDGQVISRGYETNGAAWINSTEWVNGEHKIWAMTRAVDSADTTPETEEQSNSGYTEIGIAASSVHTLTFDNFISQYFVATAFFDTQSGQTQEVSAQFKQTCDWTLYVLNAFDEVVVAYAGSGASLFVEWDGTDFDGFEVPDGFYDYYIEATTSGGQSMAMTGGSSLESEMQQTKALGSVGVLSRDRAPLMDFTTLRQASLKLPVMGQFQRDPGVQLPASDRNSLSLKPAVPSDKPIQEDFSILKIIPPGMEKVLTPEAYANMVASLLAWEDSLQQKLNEPAEIAPSSSSEENASFDDGGQTYFTFFPIRIPGLFFKGFAGSFGVAYQGHHPSWQDRGFFAFPTGASGFTSIWRPYGPLRNASGIANSFSTRMTSQGWRQAFMLADNKFQHTNLTSAYKTPTSPSTFSKDIDLGLIIGHVVGANTTPFAASMCYYPFWDSGVSGLGGNPNAYGWIAMAEMDFGSWMFQHNQWSPLKWVGIYGCNSLRLNDVNDMWTKFLLPMPPNLRILLGSDTAVYIVPEFGSRFADNMNGVSNQGVPMSVIQSWYNAGTLAHTIAGRSRNPFKRPGTIFMSAVYRSSGGGGAGTGGDTIWSYPWSYNTDWTDITWGRQQVYP